MLIKKILDKINLDDALIVAVFCALIAFLSGSYAVFFAVFFVLASAILCLAYYHKKHERLNNKSFNYAAGFFSLVSACIAIVVARNPSLINTGVSVILLLLCTALLCAAVALVIIFKTVTTKPSLNLLYKCLPFAAVMLAVFLLSLPLFRSGIAFDEWDYYINLSRPIGIDTLNDATVLKMCGHMTHFWAVAVYVLRCLTGNPYVSVILFNILLLAVSVPVAYKLVRIICPACNHWFAFACAVVFAFSPFTFGFVGYVYPQTVLAYTILFFIFALVSRDKVLTFISAILLMFTFETSIFVTAGLVFLIIVCNMAKAVRTKTFVAELKKQGLNVLNISLFLLHVFWLVVFLQSNWGGVGKGGGTGVLLSYTFNRALYRNLTLFTCFQWIICAGIVGAIVKLAVQFFRGKITLNDCFKNSALLIIGAAGFIYLTATTFISTHNYVRYLLPIYVCSYFLFFASLHYLLKDISMKKLKTGLGYGALACMFVLLLVQSYITIDPLMLSSKNRTYTGNGTYLVNPAYRYSTKHPFVGLRWYYFDPYVYNRQFANFSITLSDALDSIDYSTNKCIVTSFDLSNQYLFENKYYTNGYPHSPKTTEGHKVYHSWDKNEKRICAVYDISAAIRYTVKSNAADAYALLAKGEFVEYWFLDYNSGFAPTAQDFADQNSNIVIEESHDVSYMGWKFTLSKISLRK